MLGRDPTASHELKLEFARAEDGYELKMITSEGIAASGSFHPPFTERQVAELLERLPRGDQVLHRSFASSSSSRDAFDPVRDVGEKLFVTTFQGPFRRVYDHAQRFADAEGLSLRLRLIFSDRRLEAQPWEFLFDPERRDYVVLSSRSMLVRQRHPETGPSLEPLTHPPRVLVATADPKGMYEARKESETLAKIFESARFDFEVQREITARQFVETVHSGQFDAIHFIGNGFASWNESIEGAALMMGDGTVLPAEPLRAALRSGRGRLRLIFLNACSSARLASELADVAPAVIGVTSNAMTNSAAATFAEHLYGYLATGLTVEAAMTQARLSLASAQPGGREWGLLILYAAPGPGVTLAQAAGSIEISGTTPPVAELDPSRRAIRLQLDALEQNLKEISQQVTANQQWAPQFLRNHQKTLETQIQQLAQKLKEIA